MSRMIKLLTIMLLLIAATAKADSRDLELKVDFLVDKDLSMHTGVYFMRDFLRMYQFADDTLFYDSSGDQSNLWMAARLAKAGFLEFWFLGSLQVALQHEVFGHGGRGRELNANVRSYKIRPWEGRTTFGGEFDRLSRHKKAAVIAGGVEATGLVATDQEIIWLQKGTIDHREAVYYLANAWDQSLATLDFFGDKDTNNTDDLKFYANEVNAWHNRSVTSRKKIKDRLFLDWINPFYFYSLYNLSNYVADGTRYTGFSMLEVGDYHFLPVLRTNLAPWGPEYSLKSYIVDPTMQYHSITVNISNVGNAKSTTLSYGRYGMNINQNLSMDIALSTWRQPALFSDPGTRKNRFGLGAILTFNWAYTNKTLVVFQFGAKESGYLRGEPLSRSLIGRIGTKIDLS